MIRKEFFAVCCLVLSASAKAEVEFCHQNMPESIYYRKWGQPPPDYPPFEVGYSCKGNSGVIFTYEGNRWVTSTSQGISWEITGKQANAKEADKVCAELGAYVPSWRSFEWLTHEMKSPVTKRIFPIFALRPDASHGEYFWSHNFFSSGLRHVWDPRSGETDGRYYITAHMPVVCIRYEHP